ncbi:MAG: DinB family protein [Thaumarchaeota archaeon]|nr:DinB family protein [Nitrososphaerota archaeon]
MPAKLEGKSDLESIKEIYRYNSYVRKKYLKALEMLPKEELVRDRGGSYPSMLDIFVHVLDAYRQWFVFLLQGVSMEGFEDLMGKVRSLEKAMEEEKKVDTFVMNFVDRLDDEKIEGSFETSFGKDRWRFTIRQVLWHMVEEELQHRGELNALFWQLNIDPPITDWMDWKVETGELRKLT